MRSATSADALDQHLRSGRGKTQRERIYECLMHSAVPLTRRQVSQLTGNAVTGRVAELLEDKRVRVSHEDKDGGTGVRAQFLEPVRPQPIQRKLEWPH